MRFVTLHNGAREDRGFYIYGGHFYDLGMGHSSLEAVVLNGRHVGERIFSLKHACLSCR